MSNGSTYICRTLKQYNKMEVSEVLKWFDNNRDITTVLEVETECGMARGTLSAAIKGTRGLPKKYVEDLIILIDSLTAAPREEMIEQRTQPTEGTPEEDSSTRYETTASGIRVRFRTKYPTQQDKTSGKFLTVKEYKDKDGSTVKISFNGTAYKKTGNHKPARFAFKLKELS